MKMPQMSVQMNEWMNECIEFCQQCGNKSSYDSSVMFPADLKLRSQQAEQLCACQKSYFLIKCFGAMHIFILSLYLVSS